MKSIIRISLGLLLCHLSIAYSATFSITPQQTLPTQYISGQNSAIALYTVMNNSSEVQTGFTFTAPPLASAISQSTVTDGITYSPILCGNPIILTVGDSCTLKIAIAGQYSGPFSLCKGTLNCTTVGSVNQLNVSEVASGHGSVTIQIGSSTLNLMPNVPATITLTNQTAGAVANNLNIMGDLPAHVSLVSRSANCDALSYAQSCVITIEADSNFIAPVDTSIAGSNTNVLSLTLSPGQTKPIVVVGAATTSDTILYSSDHGTTWTAAIINLGIDPVGDLQKVIYNGSIYVVVGDQGVILTSSDGITWNAATNNDTNPLWDVVWDATDAIFVTVGDNGVILKSTDSTGTVWQLAEDSGLTTNRLTSVAWSLTNGFIAGASGLADDSGNYYNFILTSSNADRWTIQPLTGYNTNGIFDTKWLDNQFIITSAPYNPFIITSVDGTSDSWTSATLPGSIVNNSIYSVTTNQSDKLLAVCSYGVILTASTTDSSIWTASAFFPYSGEAWYDFYEATWDNAGEQFIVVGRYASDYGATSVPTITLSPDGVNWTTIDPTTLPTTARNLYGVVAP